MSNSPDIFTTTIINPEGLTTPIIQEAICTVASSQEKRAFVSPYDSIIQAYNGTRKKDRQRPADLLVINETNDGNLANGYEIISSIIDSINPHAILYLLTENHDPIRHANHITEILDSHPIVDIRSVDKPISTAQLKQTLSSMFPPLPHTPVRQPSPPFQQTPPPVKHNIIERLITKLKNW